VEYDEVIDWIHSNASDEVRDGMLWYGIPNQRAVGIPMGSLKAMWKGLGRSHQLAAELWDAGLYEARTLAAFVDEPGEVTSAQMDRWAHDFDSWAICDTVCFHLFDRTPFAWDKVARWTEASDEFVRPAGFALDWGLSVTDKAAHDARFTRASPAGRGGRIHRSRSCAPGTADRGVQGPAGRRPPRPCQWASGRPVWRASTALPPRPGQLGGTPPFWA